MGILFSLGSTQAACRHGSVASKPRSGESSTKRLAITLVDSPCLAMTTRVGRRCRRPARPTTDRLAAREDRSCRPRPSRGARQGRRLGFRFHARRRIPALASRADPGPLTLRIYRRIQGRGGFLGGLRLWIPPFAARLVVGGGRLLIEGDRVVFVGVAARPGELPHPLGGAEHAVDQGNQGRSLADGQVSGGKLVRDHGERQFRVLRRLDHRQLDRDRAGALGRQHAIHTQPHGGFIAVLGAGDEVGENFLRTLRERLGEREGLLVEASGRPTGRIAALTGLKTHWKLLSYYGVNTINTFMLSRLRTKALAAFTTP